MRELCLTLLLLVLPAPLLQSQTALSSDAPVITKIDPPNWWVNLPSPMLLLKGEHLDQGTFSLSDRQIKIERTKVSDNGHWAELWLNALPEKPETIQINVERLGAHSSTSFTFAARRAASDGFAGFSSRDVMYLIMTDRFADGDRSNDAPANPSDPHGWHGGDLRGILDHLDYMQDLGITTIWITPVYQNQSPVAYHGYHATDMYAVDHHFGSLADLRALAAALHKRRMKLVLDMVPNHVGPMHPWVDDSPEPDWFHGTKAHHPVAQTEFKPLIDPYAPWRDQHDVEDGWFVNELPDMNQENPAVEKYLVQNAIWWTEATGLDGIRIDTFPYVGRPFWKNFHQELHTLYPKLTTVGEISSSDPIITSSFAGGAARSGSTASVDTGLDTPFDFPSFYALRDAFLKEAPMTRIADTLREDTLYPHPERLVPFIGNHDESRFMSEPGASLERLTLAFTVLTTMRGMPQIYAGDEIAMRGGDDPDNRRDFPGGFGSAPGAFTQAGRSPEQQEEYSTLQSLLKVRRDNPALQVGDMQVLHADNDVLIYSRTLKSGNAIEHIIVAVNKAADSKTTTVATDDTDVHGLHLSTPLWGRNGTCSATQNSLTCALGPESAIILDLH